MIWAVLIAGGIYIMVIAFFLYGWEKLKGFTPAQRECKTFVSVIVPMRNEQLTITRLLYDLYGQNYPADLHEIIVVNDHSTDQSSQKAGYFQKDNIKILSLPESHAGKKAAIRFGIEAARGELIVTTDADCHIGNNWLRCLAEYYEKYSPVMILGPVIASPRPSASGRTSSPKERESGLSLHIGEASLSGRGQEGGFPQMQALELFSLLGSTAGAVANGYPIMCNGANLAFVKTIYPEIEHIYKNEKIRSGDDMFVMLELKKKYPNKIHFLKSTEATVNTLLINNLFSFFRQRKRWAAKAKFYNDISISGTALIVFLVNMLLMTCLVIGFVKGNFFYFLILFLIKSAIDFPFLYRVTTFFGEKQLMRWFPVVQSFYFLYVCFTAIAAMITPITWKGRVIKY
jgi:glycosyltransferase involved in cell wall biosynthesis